MKESFFFHQMFRTFFYFLNSFFLYKLLFYCLSKIYMINEVSFYFSLSLEKV